MLEGRSDYLKIDEAARLLGVSARTVYRWIWKGDLPAAKMGGLYFIKRADLNAVMANKRMAQATGGLGLKPVTEQLLLKCGACYRLLASEAQVARGCSIVGCERVICTECAAEGVKECAEHAPSREQKLAQAEQLFRDGVLPLFVRGDTARLREINYLNRIRFRLSRFSTIRHPISGEAITIADWDALCEAGDDRAQVMALLGRVVLDNTQLTQTPLNAHLMYYIPQAKKQNGVGLDIRVQALSHLPDILRNGYAARELGVEELVPQLVEPLDSAHFSMVVLAGVHGWKEEARQIILDPTPGNAFFNPKAIYYLYDMEKGDLVYNPSDERARLYAELFAPLTPTEEIEEAVRAVENEMLLYSSLTLAYASGVLPYSQAVLQQAFERMAASGGYKLTQAPDFGLALVRG